jgi:signal transduction histidine kinase
MRNLSIKKKLYLIILVIFIPMITYEVFQIQRSFEESIDLELKSNQDFAEAVGVSFNNYLDRIWGCELSMGMSISNNPTENANEIGSYMKSMLEDYPTIREYAWVDISTLKITASSNAEAVVVSLSGREYIHRILNGESKTVSDLVVSRIYPEPTLVVARGIRKDNILKGIMIATVNAEELGKVLPSGRAANYSFFGLVDKQGVFVYRNGVPNVAEKNISVKDSPNMAPAFKGEIVKVKKYISPITGEAMTGVNLPVSGIGWVIYANTAYDKVLLRTYNKIAMDILMLLFITIVGVTLSIIIARQILKPISILQASAAEMSNGNLNVRTNIIGTDEIALAAQTFDKMAAAIEEYDTLKTQSFSNLSHELKTPLNIILASIQMIENSHCVSNESKYIPIMKQNCFRLLRLINNLIDITRIDSGFLKFNFANYNIVSVVEDITLSVTNYSESRGIDIVFDTDIEEKIIACDPDKIERIILNLLSNSIKFTNPGGSIFVNIYDNKEKIAIKVKDTGIGIPADKLSAIFERFRQVDCALQREYEGSGIGLSLVKALVEAHKGSITVQSQCEQGTEITIELPNILVSEDITSIKNNLYNRDMERVQRINIEFSDIYS